MTTYSRVENYTDLTDGGATIQIMIDANTVIFLSAPAGTPLTTYAWKVRKQVQLSDSVFSGYPYVRVLFPVIPSGYPENVGQVSNESVFKASDALTLTFK